MSKMNIIAEVLKNRQQITYKICLSLVLNSFKSNILSLNKIKLHYKVT